MAEKSNALIPKIDAKKKSDFPDFYPASQKKVEIGKTQFIKEVK